MAAAKPTICLRYGDGFDVAATQRHSWMWLLPVGTRPPGTTTGPSHGIAQANQRQIVGAVEYNSLGHAPLEERSGGVTNVRITIQPGE